MPAASPYRRVAGPLFTCVAQRAGAGRAEHHVVEPVNSCLDAVNSMYYGSHGVPDTPVVHSLAEPPVIKRESLRHVRQSVVAAGTPPSGLTCSGALSALRACDADDDGGPGHVGAVVPLVLVCCPFMMGASRLTRLLVSRVAMLRRC